MAILRAFSSGASGHSGYFHHSIDGEIPASLIDKLKLTQQADGSRHFDHIALAYRSNIRTSHYLANCLSLIAGCGTGVMLRESIVVENDSPLCNA